MGEADDYLNMRVFSSIQKLRNCDILSKEIDARIVDTKYSSILFGLCYKHWFSDGGKQMRLYSYMD